MRLYDNKKLELKWQKKWGKDKAYRAEDFDKKPKFYALVEFPYPSGEGLHLGHAFTNIILDILVRKKRMSGFNVLYPMGWDAFGLPTENYAIKTGIQPSRVTEKNIGNFKNQMKKLALAYDWDREINTTNPHYYKWTQWIFLKFFEKGLAYKGKASVGWCSSCKIILANEEIINGKCERCGTEVERRIQKQWILRITKYADRLANELELVDYPTSVQLAQRNWIGRSEGVAIKFKVNSPLVKNKEIEIFTTRIDTIFGVSFIVLSPEHPISLEIANTNPEIARYIKAVSKKSERERQMKTREKTGLDTVIKVINPINRKQVPLWISDFVLSGYGTGAIMGVPGHDERDKEFALKFDLPILKVVENGILINSGEYNGLNYKNAQRAITSDLGSKAKKKVMYHLRDWIFSRQHYWGEPIPIVECPRCRLVPVPEDQLPVKLPEVEKYQPTETGESPLAAIKEWVNTTCPKCGGKAKRETDTMPNWAGSSWYFLRYVDPKNNKKFADFKKLNYWMPVDLYLGGAEHTTLHLLYSRFWHKFLNDLNLVPGKEPYRTRRQHGIILAEDGTKMSKSKGNIINPDDMIKRYGCDTLRTYLAFMGPYDQTMPWSTAGIEGARRFVNRVWKIFQGGNKIGKVSNKDLVEPLNNTIKKVSADIDKLKHNTAIAALMIFLKLWEKNDSQLSKKDAQKYLILLSPFMPYLTEELWQRLGKKSSIHKQSWPKVDKSATGGHVTIVIMVDGKKRDLILAKKGTGQRTIEILSKNKLTIKRYLNGNRIKKVIFVVDRTINFVTI